MLEGYTIAQKKPLILNVEDYYLIVGHHYKFGIDDIFHRCILKHEREAIMMDAQERPIRG